MASSVEVCQRLTCAIKMDVFERLHAWRGTSDRMIHATERPINKTNDCLFRLTHTGMLREAYLRVRLPRIVTTPATGSICPPMKCARQKTPDLHCCFDPSSADRASSASKAFSYLRCAEKPSLSQPWFLLHFGKTSGQIS